MFTIRLLGALLLAGAMATGAQPAFAQAQSGVLTGRVTLALDATPVHGATVIVVGARRTVTTGDDGAFTIASLPPGTYEVIVQREHLSAVRQTVTVVAGQTATVAFTLTLEATHEEVTVTASAVGAATAFDSFNAVTSLDSTEILKSLGPTIADVLQNEAGIAKRSFGPGSSRPIIRGFDGDRVLIMQDGVRTGDLSSQSGDHGVSIDPAGLSRLEVVKGPATLLYGSNALGGVVNAISAQDAFRSIPFTGTLGGVTFDLGSANTQAGFSGNVQRGQGPWLVYGNATSRRTGDYDSPEGAIPNSATRLVTADGGLGWSASKAFFGVGAGIERNRYGVPFAGVFEGEADAEIDLRARRQHVRFDAGVRNMASAFVDTLRVTVSYLDYAHDELEIEDGEETLGTQFENTVLTVRTEVEQKRVGRLGGRLGVEFFTRDYRAVGAEALAPDTTHRSVAAFAYQEVDYGRQRIQFGGRLEHNGYTSELDRSFGSVSGSFGVHRELGRSSAVVVNATGASRAPALEELFNFGPHIGNLAFEIGNPDLVTERSVGIDASVRARGTRAAGEVNFFTYGISNFVFLDVTDEIEDGLRVAHYTQADSRFTGAEMSGHVDLHARATLTASLGLVRARLTESGEALPRIPPAHGRVELVAKAGSFTVSPEVVFSATQSRVFRDETTTDGWATVNINATWARQAGHQSHLVAFSAYNLGNETYRSHTSFLKDLAPEIGRGVKLTYTVRFF